MEIPIKLSEIEALRNQGYEIIRGADVSKANGDYFVIMEKITGDGSRSIRIFCPSFLRGGIAIHGVTGSISY